MLIKRKEMVKKYDEVFTFNYRLFSNILLGLKK